MVQRFNCLLLDPREIFFSDHAAFYQFPNKPYEERTEWERLVIFHKIKGRLKVCSRSLVFDPQSFEFPIIKLPLRNCSSIKEGKFAPSSDSEFEEEGHTLEVDSNVAVEILENNTIKPYNFRKEQRVYIFKLSFKKISDVLPQIQQLHRASSLPPNEETVMIESIVRSLQRRKCQDKLLLSDGSEETIVQLEASKISPLVTYPGIILITNRALYFQPINNMEAENFSLRIILQCVKQIIKRRYLLRHVGLEFFYEERGRRKYTYLTFKSCSDRDTIYDCLVNQDLLCLENLSLPSLSYKWQVGFLSNFDYISQLNSLADRTVNDLTQYPVFPWIIADYESSELDLSKKETFRELLRPIGALNAERLEKLKKRSREMPDPKFLYGSHYSTPGFVLFYLVRLHPLYMLCLQNGKFDHPDRMFNSIIESWENVTKNPADFKELIPEFYDIDAKGEFLENRKAICFGTRHNGEPVWNVSLPPWAKSSEDLVCKFREALECDYVSENINHWIDLIFGYKQTGKAAEEADNVFYPLCYEGSVDFETITDLNEKVSIESQIMEFGQIPKQLFHIPHRPKSRFLSAYRSLQLKRCNDDAFKGIEDVENMPSLFHLYHHLSNVDVVKETELQTDKVCHIIMVSTSNGNLVISLCTDGSLKINSFPDLKRVGHFMFGNLAYSSCIPIPHTNEILISCWDNYLYRFNYKLFQKRESLQAHSDAISCLDLHENTLITGSLDCLVRVWNIRSNLKPDNQSNLNTWSNWKLLMNDMICQMDHDAPVVSVAFCPGGQTFASATTDGEIAIWTTMIERRVHNVKGHEGEVNGVVWNPDGDYLFSYGCDGKALVTEVHSGSEASAIFVGSGINKAIWDGRMAIVGLDNGTLLWLDMGSSQTLKSFTLHSGPVSALTLSLCKQYVISVGQDRKMLILGNSIT